MALESARRASAGTHGALTRMEAGMDHARRGIVATGVGFVVLFVAGMLLLGELIGAFADPDAFLVSYYANDDYHVRDLAGGHLVVVAALALLLFLQQLIRHLGALGGSAAGLDAARTSGVVAVTLILAGAAAMTTVTYAKAFGRVTGDEPLTSPAVSLAPQLGCLLILWPAMWSMALAIGLVAWSCWPARLWPGWLRWLSVAAAGLLLLSAAGFMPVVMLPVWVVGVSVWAWRSTVAVPARATG
jgi:hypothetical protein